MRPPNAKPHEKAKLVVKIDLVDFFPTLHFRRVRGVFNQLGYSQKVAHVLASLTTYRPTFGGGGDDAEKKPFVAWPGVLPSRGRFASRWRGSRESAADPFAG